ncbi:unnamed protein product, partial [Onchocerca flexuosa]|uniref:Product n=1 Tax=Onchocerca flexuosa TaxID=387005 RepID=A0A183HLH8_9BILA
FSRFLNLLKFTIQIFKYATSSTTINLLTYTLPLIFDSRKCSFFRHPRYRSLWSNDEAISCWQFIKTIIGYNNCEAIIFVFLGLSTVSKKHNWDSVFIVTTLIACLKMIE